MSIRQSVRVIRRWVSVVTAGGVIGILVGWLSAPGAPAPTRMFQASHTLIGRPGSESISHLRAGVREVRFGAVPGRVAVRLQLDRPHVQSIVSAEYSSNLRVLVITARTSDRAQAEALANVTAEELLVELGGPKAPLSTLEPAVASPVETGEILGPRSRPSRALLFGAFGLTLGVGAAFTVDRLDNGIRSKRRAGEILGVPVLAQVPPIPRSGRDRLVTAAETSPFVEAYRGLRTSVDRWATQAGNGAGCRVILVTSPSFGEGKTVTVAHLAVALADMGRSVMAISADLRRPRLHLYFDRPEKPGLVDVLQGAPGTRQLTDLNLVTGMRGVSFVASGAPVDNPSPLLDRIGAHLEAARTLADIVLVDAPPLLTSSEAAELAVHSDGVVLVVRAGRTPAGAAGRSLELLERLGIPVLGVVLVGTDDAAVGM